MNTFPEGIKAFIESVTWTYAKTYAATWPHWYIVRKNVDEGMFVKLVEYIRANDYDGQFYKQTNKYFDDDTYSYWTMGALIAETEVINRCLKEDTYEKRLAKGTLPEENKKSI